MRQVCGVLLLQAGGADAVPGGVGPQHAAGLQVGGRDGDNTI
jgi:hypothetical protein